MARDVSTVK